MNILFLTPSLYTGGAERWVLCLAGGMKTMRPCGILRTTPLSHPHVFREARRICPVRYPEGELREHETNREIQRIVYPPHKKRALFEEMSLDADVVVAWGVHDLAHIAGGCDIPVVEVSQSAPDLDWTEKCMKDFPPHRATHFAAVSKTAARSFPKQYRRKAKVIYNGGELDRVVPTISREDQRKSWGVPNDKKVLLFMGRIFDPNKGVDRLVAALKHLPEDWVLVLVGPLTADSKHAEAVKNQWGFEHSGRIYMAEYVTSVGNAMAASDVIAMPSKTEAHSLLMLEAMLARIPIVTTNSLASKEMRDRHGAIFTMLDQNAPPKTFAEAVLEALMRREIAAHAFLVAWENYTSPAMVRNWEMYLEEVVRGWRKKKLFGGAAERLEGVHIPKKSPRIRRSSKDRQHLDALSPDGDSGPERLPMGTEDPARVQTAGLGEGLPGGGNGEEPFNTSSIVMGPQPDRWPPPRRASEDDGQ